MIVVGSIHFLKICNITENLLISAININIDLIFTLKVFKIFCFCLRLWFIIIIIFSRFSGDCIYNIVLVCGEK